jgi:hypothetical protein
MGRSIMKDMNTYLAAGAAVLILIVGLWYLNTNSAEAPTEVPEPAQNEEQTEAAENIPKPVTQKPTVTPTAPAPTTQTETTQEPPAPPAPQATYVNADEKVIFVVLPRPGDTVTAGITISGTARGDWFTQGTFRAEVIAENGDVLVRNQIPAQGNAMTTALVQFSSMVQISPNYHGPATVILHNDNPDGHPNPDRSVSIPIVVK